MAGWADLPLAFSILILCFLLQRLMATTGSKSFKSASILFGQAYKCFEAPLPIKQLGYSEKLMHTMSSNGSWALEDKGTTYLRIFMEII